MADTGTLYPGTAFTAAVAPFAGLDWTTPGAVTADDTTYANITSASFDTGTASYMLYARGYGATIPADGTVTGVQVEIGKYYATGAARDGMVSLINGAGTPIGNNLGSLSTSWNTSIGTTTYGGAGDLWGAALSPAIVNSSAFGVQFAATAAGNNCDAFVDFIRMVVYYSPAGGGIPNGTVTPGEAAQSQLSDAAGFSSVSQYNPITGTLDSFTRADGTALGASWAGPFVAGSGKWRTGNGAAIPAEGDYPLLISANGRYLATPEGAPVLLLGDAGWLPITQLTDAGIDTYLNDRQARGFNAILAELIERGFSTNKPNNIDNVAPFTGALFTTPNETYMTRADYLIDQAAARGMCILLSPLYQGYAGTEEGWDTEIGTASAAAIQSWGEYCGNRYADRKNIIWVMGGDAAPGTLLPKYGNFMTGLQSFIPNPMTTFHDARNTTAADHLAGAAWLTLNDTYSTVENTPVMAGSAYAYGTVMPFIQLEGYYENRAGITPANLRFQFYETMLSGGCGHIYGNDTLWLMTGAWAGALDDPGALNMTTGAAFLRSKQWHNLAPDTTHTVLTVGYGTLGNADYAACAITPDDTLALVYMPSNRSMTVDMSEFSGSVTCHWFDPTNGTYADDAASPHANTGTHDFSHAGTNSAGDADWVLCLEVT